MASFRSLSRQKRDTSSTPSISSVRPPRALNFSHAPFSTQMTQDMPARPEQPPRMGHRLANIAIARPTALSDSPLMPKLTEGPVQNEFRERASSPVTDISQRLQNKHENATGLPDELKTGIEHLSGLSLDDVRVYYHSPQPARVDALAFTQGTQIHVASGQEQHLAHEAWRVVQQEQGRVKP